MSNEKKVAIIGVGNIGTAIATNTVKGNRPVILASRKLEDAEALSNKLGDLATAAEIPDAINQADIVVVAVWFNSIQEVFTTYEKELEGKIIIDPSNAIAVDDKGNVTKTIPDNESAGQINAQNLPKNATLVKAMGSLSAHSLATASFQQPNEAVLFYATDNTDIDTDVEKFIHDNGYEALRVGKLDQSRRIEVLGDLNEFSIKKTVDLDEAKTKI
ncbi:MAG: NAD(P)-binding domain-containing protein [Algoriella sp.]|uniref:NADPH-dependent F420 reductase n=1 Tax=Algoriella sp. TaxID=1872434 RepID=UPI002FC988D3